MTADPDEVPRLMEDEKPRLVLLDLMLPGTDGIIVMKSIHDVADVPIIFLSALRPGPGDRQSIRDGSRRLRRETLLPYRARGQDSRRSAQPARRSAQTTRRSAQTIT